MISYSKYQHNRAPCPPSVEEIFVNRLLHWHQNENDRSMPWKGEKDPYRIWLSEIILQQTRVAQGLKYYEKFISAFPDVHSLAAAPPEKVFKLWEGLGYYSRCSNLIHSARYISKELNGVFPDDYENILLLKGVGSYIASAIASFAYNLPHAVLDGNVFRVLSRVLAIEDPIDSSAGKKKFAATAQQLLPEGKASLYNQAIMDFGAVICSPVPVCASCFINDHCKAYRQGKQDVLPVKEKKVKTRKRWFSYFITTCRGYVLIRQRKEGDIWKQLYEFPLIENEKSLPVDTQLVLFEKQFGFSEYQLLDYQKKEQKLTHQSICFQLMHVEVHERIKIADYKWIKISQVDQYAFPITLQSYLKFIRK